MSTDAPTGVPYDLGFEVRFPSAPVWSRGADVYVEIELVDEVESSPAEGADTDAVLHSVTDLRLLLARAYFQSAQLGRAEATLVRVIEQAPTDSYAHLLLGRTLQRAGRHAEAARPLALAEALGGYERPEAYGATRAE